MDKLSESVQINNIFSTLKTFKNLQQNHWTNFNQTWYKGIHVSRGDNNDIKPARLIVRALLRIVHCLEKFLKKWYGRFDRFFTPVTFNYLDVMSKPIKSRVSDYLSQGKTQYYMYYICNINDVLDSWFWDYILTIFCSIIKKRR